MRAGLHFLDQPCWNRERKKELFQEDPEKAFPGGHGHEIFFGSLMVVFVAA